MADAEETHKIQVEEVSFDVANERKEQGNDAFRAGKWNEALVAYQSALRCLPKRKPKATPDTVSSGTVPGAEGTNEGSQSGAQSLPTEVDVVEISTPAVADEDQKAKKLRAVINANIGACFVKMSDHKAAVDACSEALLDDPDYVKALERRANSNNTLNTWSSLSSAQDDYTKLLQLSPTTAQEIEYKRKLQALKPRIEVAQKRETDEMMSKLKGLGNSILGNFGLSTDNFKFTPNGQGGYSMNFSQ